MRVRCRGAAVGALCELLCVPLTPPVRSLCTVSPALAFHLPALTAFTMDDDGDFVLNTVVSSAPRPAEKRTNHSAKRATAAAAAQDNARTPRGGASSRGRARGGRGGAALGTRGAPSPRQPAQKRKQAPTAAAAAADEHANGTSDEFGVVPIEVDDDDSEPTDPAAAAQAAAEARKAEWKSLKQPRWDGSKSASSSSAAAAAAASSAVAGSSVAAAVAPAPSSSSSSSAAAAPAVAAAAPKKYTRPAAKPLPHIVRHSTAQLDAAALRPITPQSSQHQESVFGRVETEDPATVKKEGEEPAHLKEDPSLPPLPTTGFGALGLSPRLLRALVEKMELKYPTRIQKEGIPLLLGKDGNRPDALIKSETGSGKTLTYLIPIVERLSTEAQRPDRSQGTRAIILSPTRELVLQILGVCQSLLDKAGFYFLIAGMIMGGEKKKSEKARLRKGLHILVCTPGRLLDHLENTEALVLDRLSYFVLDEADRLMDMGFERDLAKIVSLLDEKSKAGAKASLPAPAIVDPRTGLAIQSAKSKLASERALALALSQCARQNILVSATLNKEIEKMASITLTNPTLIGFKTAPEESKLKNEDGSAMDLVNANEMVHDTSLPVGLVQQYLQVEHRHKLVALAALLRKKVVEAEMSGRHFKAVVFFSTCASVEFHHSLMSFSFWPYDQSMMGSKDKSALLDTQLLKLHGNLTQQERTRTYNQFCKDAEGILLCTDVAARGLDLPAVDYILQYDAPEDTADYIHRVGRTARMGRKGQAILFLTSEEMEYLNILKDKSVSAANPKQSVRASEEAALLTEIGAARRSGRDHAGSLVPSRSSCVFAFRSSPSPCPSLTSSSPFTVTPRRIASTTTLVAVLPPARSSRSNSRASWHPSLHSRRAPSMPTIPSCVHTLRTPSNSRASSTRANFISAMWRGVLHCRMRRHCWPRARL